MLDNECMIRIETKFAYQEDTIQSLNDVICQQQKQIEQLEATCKVLIERFGSMSERIDTGELEDEIPPHY